MDLEELRGFLAVVETGSLLGAATRLGVPRATLRRRIDSLEARAGVPLLDRGPRGVTSTEAGVLLAERGRRLLAEGAALLAATRQLGRQPSGPLRLRAVTGLHPNAVVVLGEFIRLAMPALQFQLHVCDDPLAGALDDVELAITFGEPDEAAPWIVCAQQPIQLRPMASPTYLARVGAPTDVTMLSEHRLMTWAPPGRSADHWPLRAGGTIEVSSVVVTNDPHLLRQHALAGQGIALLPDADLDPLGLSADELRPVLDDVIGDDVSLCLSRPATKAESPRVSRVVALWSKFTQQG